MPQDAPTVGRMRGRIRDLGPVPCETLIDAVRRLDETAWAQERYRQQACEAHRSTQASVLGLRDARRWPRLAVVHADGRHPRGDSAWPVMNAIVACGYELGGVVIRAMAVRLPAGGRIAPHVDTHASLRLSHRIHVPLVTNPRVRFFIDGVPHRFAAGRAVEINNQLSHSVMNDGPDDRVHLIFDYLPPERLAEPDRLAG